MYMYVFPLEQKRKQRKRNDETGSRFRKKLCLKAQSNEIYYKRAAFFSRAAGEMGNSERS